MKSIYELSKTIRTTETQMPFDGIFDPVFVSQGLWELIEQVPDNGS